MWIFLLILQIIVTRIWKWPVSKNRDIRREPKNFGNILVVVTGFGRPSDATWVFFFVRMEIIDNINKTLKENMIATLRSGSKVAIAASSFSIYAFQELKEQLSDISELRFTFTSPSFITEKTDKQKREFCVVKIGNISTKSFEVYLMKQDGGNIK